MFQTLHQRLSDMHASVSVPRLLTTTRNRQNFRTRHTAARLREMGLPNCPAFPYENTAAAIACQYLLEQVPRSISSSLTTSPKTEMQLHRFWRPYVSPLTGVYTVCKLRRDPSGALSDTTGTKTSSWPRSDALDERSQLKRVSNLEKRC